MTWIRRKGAIELCVLFLLSAAVCQIFNKRTDWQEVTIEGFGFRDKITRGELEARFGLPSWTEKWGISAGRVVDRSPRFLPDFDSKGNIALPKGLPTRAEIEVPVWQLKKEPDGILIKFFHDKEGSHLVGNRILRGGRVLVVGDEWSPRDYNLKASQVQTLLGQTESRNGEMKLRYLGQGRELWINFLRPEPIDAVENFEMVLKDQ